MPEISEKDLSKIVELCESVPEVYRAKCFELLLQNALQVPSLPSKARGLVGEEVREELSLPSGEFILPIDVKAFLSQYGLDESILWEFFLIEGAEIRPISKLSTTKKAQAQIQHALLMSLETAIISGQFEVGLENLRTRCKDQKTYDSANFMKNLKGNSNLFKVIDDVEKLALSPEGKSELADLLEELIAGNG